MTEERAREIAGLTHFRSALTGDEIVESVTQLILAACAEERRACAEACRTLRVDGYDTSCELTVELIHDDCAKAIEGMK